MGTGPRLNPAAAAFVPTYGTGSDLASWAQGLTEKKGGAGSQSSGGKANPAVLRNDAAGRRTGPRPNADPQPSSGSRADGAGNGITSSSGRGSRGRGGSAWGDANGGRAAPAQHADASPFAAVPTATTPQLGLPSINTQAKPAQAKSSARFPPQGRPPAAHPPAHIPSLKTQPVAVHAQSLATLASKPGGESWTASHTRRAIGSDSGDLDLDFDDVFGGQPGSRDGTASGGGGSLAAAASLESPPAAVAAADQVHADLVSAHSLEETLAEGGMVATSYAEVEGPAVVAETPAAAAAGQGVEPGGSPRTPRTPANQVLHRPGDTPMSPSKVSPADFQVLKVVGQGAFGKVFQVRKRDTGRIYAMKVMRKDRILARDHGEYVRAERDVLTSVRHPFIVQLHWSFQTAAKLYLVLDFVNGGHLFFNLYRAGIFDEEQARLYTAEIVAAIAHLHSLHIVHRDLKPENVLLDSEGHIRITDFGLAKSGMRDGERSNSLIGTMEYMAPEIISGSGHNKGVDWWSVGILLYEMLCGVTPFRQKDKAKLRRMITCDKLKFTKNADGYLSGDAKSLVRMLLEKDPARRLGYGPDGAAAVKQHPFFRPINWKALDARQIPSPYCPRTSGIECIDNFDKLWTDRTPEDSPVGTPVGTPVAGNSFRGFTYVAPSFLTSPTASPSKPGIL